MIKKILTVVTLLTFAQGSHADFGVDTDTDVISEAGLIKGLHFTIWEPEHTFPTAVGSGILSFLPPQVDDTIFWTVNNFEPFAATIVRVTFDANPRCWSIRWAFTTVLFSGAVPPLPIHQEDSTDFGLYLDISCFCT